MNKEEIKELKDYHKRCIESIDYYYLSDSFYEIHNKVFNEIEELHNKIDKLTNNLENSINNINVKLGDKEIRVENGKIVNPINDYRTVRLKAIRMKCKELQEILKGSGVDE